MIKYRASLATNHRIDNSITLANLVTVLSLRGREAEALAEIEAVEARRPRVAENLVAAANAYAVLGKWDRALLAADRAIRLNRRSAGAHLQRGFALGGLHRHVEAVNALMRAREFGSETSMIEFGLAWQLSLAGRVEEALAVAKEAVERIPKGFHGRMALAFAQLAAGDVREALANFELADHAFSHFEVLKAGWGDALLMDGQPEAAITKFEAAITENPHTSQAWRGWGEALSKLGRHREALEKFERALREDANDPRILRGWAEALSVLGREDDAQTKWRHADALERRHAAFGHGKATAQASRVGGPT